MRVGQARDLAVEAEDESLVRTREPRRVFDQHLQNRVQVERRAADGLKHFGGRSLPLERLLRLVEQTHVLDRDDRLVGEGFQEPDLSVRKRLHLQPCDVDGADRRIAPHHRYGEDAAVADRAGALGLLRIVRHVLRVGDRDDAPLENRTRREALSSRRRRIRGPDDVQSTGRTTVVGCHADHRAVESEHDTERGVAKARRA